jgi:hypothetical protein
MWGREICKLCELPTTLPNNNYLPRYFSQKNQNDDDEHVDTRHHLLFFYYSQLLLQLSLMTRQKEDEHRYQNNENPINKISIIEEMNSHPFLHFCSLHFLHLNYCNGRCCLGVAEEIKEGVGESDAPKERM